MPCSFFGNIAVKSIIAGVDEAGRGALAGPVVAAAVVLDRMLDPAIFKDSKAIGANERERLFQILLESNSIIGVGIHSHRFVDRLNVLGATMSAMTRSVHRLGSVPESILIDGNRVPLSLFGRAKAIVKGDATVPVISAASVVAKVTRDRIMIQLGCRFPDYGFEIHKGYATAVHYAALARWGPCDVHRKTFNLTVQESLF